MLDEQQAPDSGRSTQAGMPRRAWIMLAVLAALALGLAIVGSVLAPAGTPDFGPGSLFRPAPGPGGPPLIISATPGPGLLLTPGPGGRGGLGTIRQGRGAFFFLTDEGGLQTGLAGRIAALLLLLSLGGISLYLAPARLGRIAACLSEGRAAVGRLALIGLAGAIIVAVLNVLAVAALGPFWLLLGVFSLYAAALAGLFAVSLPLGRWAGRRFGLTASSALVDLAAGLLIICSLAMVPWIGLLLLALPAIIGFGAVIQTRGGSADDWEWDLPSLQY